MRHIESCCSQKTRANWTTIYEWLAFGVSIWGVYLIFHLCIWKQTVLHLFCLYWILFLRSPWIFFKTENSKYWTTPAKSTYKNSTMKKQLSIRKKLSTILHIYTVNNTYLHCDSLPRYAKQNIFCSISNLMNDLKETVSLCVGAHHRMQWRR